MDNYYFWFETNQIDDHNYLSYYFYNPVEVIVLWHEKDLVGFFGLLEKLTKTYYVAGYLSYEMGYLFEKKLSHKQTNYPLAIFCAYDKPIIYDHRKKSFTRGSFSYPQADLHYSLKNIKWNTTKKDYYKNIHKIKSHIIAGDVYQVNYTTKYSFDFEGSAIGLYLNLKQRQKVSYNVFAKLDDFYILSLSPELFFSLDDNIIKLKPMKGTITRGRSLKEDKNNIDFLIGDEKNKSENIMIVDLIRNDIGRVSDYGSVRVDSLLDVEKYNTLFQMTSSIEARLNDISYFDLFRAIFPSGSITGAPKIRSMEIIKEIEHNPRNIYTGSIGFFEPGHKAMFNVAIRTLLIRDNRAEFGVGGGIVYDSISENELRECRLKTQFIKKRNTINFSLIETINFNKGLYEHLDLHLDRLSESALYFDFSYNVDRIMDELIKRKFSLKDYQYRIRFLLHSDGSFDIESHKVDNLPNEYRIGISSHIIDSTNLFYFHKTTNRKLYNAELKRARDNNLFDVIFLNEKSELTEGTISNLYVRLDGIIYTPPISSGLLDGIIRRIMIDKGKVIEKVLVKDDILKADDIYISNSIIGFRSAILSL